MKADESDEEPKTYEVVDEEVRLGQQTQSTAPAAAAADDDLLFDVV